MRKLLFIIGLGLSIMSCEKPELITEDMTVNKQDRLIRNITGKTTTQFTLEINDQWDVVGETETGFKIYSMSYWEGEELIVGTTTYYIDQMNSLVVDYDINDSEKHSFNVILEGDYKIVQK